jgi:hypothetical protein
VGDSHSYDLFHAVNCFLIEQYNYSYSGAFPYENEMDAFQHLEKHVEHYKPPECLPLIEGTMVCQIRVNKGHMMREHALPMLQVLFDQPVPDLCCACYCYHACLCLGQGLSSMSAWVVMSVGHPTPQVGNSRMQFLHDL